MQTRKISIIMEASMPKEAIIAIVIGFLFGLLITFGIYTANRSLKEKERPVASPQLVSSPISSPIPEAELQIDSPENESLVDEEEITIRGRTEPEAIIAIFTETNEHLLTASREGTFSASIRLVKGVNNIKITAVDKLDQEAEQDLTIVYSTVKIE